MSARAVREVELLRFEPESGRTSALFAALMAAAPRQGVQVRHTTAYEGKRPWLMLWGPGAPERAAAMRRHVEAGGRAVAFDLAYWNRDRKVRLSIDAAHPQAWVMQRALPADRWTRDRPPVAETWKPTGPVVIAGIGDKARIQYGPDVVDAWERAMIRTVRERWPGRALVYRKKKAGSPVPDGVAVSQMQPIESVLAGASLVITWHSNVAVDAIRLGIPVICRDGAAAAVCPSDFGDADPVPLPVEVRDRFLRNLAYFQWDPNEAGACWQFLREVLQ